MDARVDPPKEVESPDLVPQHAVGACKIDRQSAGLQRFISSAGETVRICEMGNDARKPGKVLALR